MNLRKQFGKKIRHSLDGLAYSDGEYIKWLEKRYNKMLELFDKEIKKIEENRITEHAWEEKNLGAYCILKKLQQKIKGV